uniref:Uncharacterized protein n=1 Tax=Arundo donax TaxID=35708 RepID=A0A0A9GF98_ARUDO
MKGLYPQSRIIETNGSNSLAPRNEQELNIKILSYRNHCASSRLSRRRKPC